MNKVILMGNLGQDPDTRYMPDGRAVTQISVATNRSWKDKQSGEQKDETSWHRCVAYGPQAETIAEHFTKGRKILIEGRIKYGDYEKDGIKMYTTDIVIDRFEFVEKKGGNRPPHPADRPNSDAPSAGTQEPPTAGAAGAGQGQTGDPDDPGASEEDFDDDIPF